MNEHALPWRARATEIVGHHALRLLIVSILAVVAVGLYPPPGLFALTVPAGLFAFVIVTFLLMRAHDRALCEQCVRDIPLDAAGRAAALRNRFWMAHTGSEPRFLFPYLLVLVGSNFFVTNTVGRVAWALVQLSMIYLLLSQSTHRKLQPWCPWCRDGGGGSDVDETPPVLPNDDRERV
ncbi:hypothetical protein [Jatrophihabitans fulvus]